MTLALDAPSFEVSLALARSCRPVHATVPAPAVAATAAVADDVEQTLSREAAPGPLVNFVLTGLSECREWLSLCRGWTLLLRLSVPPVAWASSPATLDLVVLTLRRPFGLARELALDRFLELVER